MNLSPSAKRYLEIFENWNMKTIKEELNECDTKAEIQSKKEKIINEVKKEHYPKICEREIIKYIRSL